MAVRYKETLKRVTGGAKIQFDFYMGQVEGSVPLDKSGEPIREEPRPLVVERFYLMYLGDPADRGQPEVNVGTKEQPIIERSKVDHRKPAGWDKYWSFRK